MEVLHKPFVARGPGFWWPCDTEEDARALVAGNRAGAVYRLLPGPDHCEHGIPDTKFCEPCNREYKQARRENEIET